MRSIMIPSKIINNTHFYKVILSFIYSINHWPNNLNENKISLNIFSKRNTNEYDKKVLSS